jgi:hypothetical protein
LNCVNNSKSVISFLFTNHKTRNIKMLRSPFFFRRGATGLCSFNIVSSKRFFSLTAVTLRKKKAATLVLSEDNNNVTNFADVEDLDSTIRDKLMHHHSTEFAALMEGCKEKANHEFPDIQKKFFGLTSITPSNPYLLGHAFHHFYEIHGKSKHEHTVALLTYLLQKLSNGKIDFQRAESLADSLFKEIQLVEQTPPVVAELHHVVQEKLLELNFECDQTSAAQVLDDGCKNWNDPRNPPLQKHIFGTTSLLPSDPYLLAYALHQFYKVYGKKRVEDARCHLTCLLLQLAENKMDFVTANCLAPDLLSEIEDVMRYRNPPK